MTTQSSSSSECSDSFTDMDDDQLYSNNNKSYINMFRPTVTYPQPTFEINNIIMVIAPDERTDEIVSTIYSDIQDQIDAVYIFSDDSHCEYLNQCKSDSIYNKITDHVFSIDLLDQLFPIIKNSFRERIKQPDRKSTLIIMDCEKYSNKLINSNVFGELIFNGQHRGITCILVSTYPIKITPELRSNLFHVVLCGSYDDSEMKLLYYFYLSMFPKLSIFRDTWDEMKKNDILHVVQRGRRIDESVFSKVKIYPISHVDNNLRFINAVNTDLVLDK